MLELHGQMMKRKDKALKVTMVDVKLARYDTFFQKHTLLKFETVDREEED
jgi:hypothetical protein